MKDNASFFSHIQIMNLKWTIMIYLKENLSFWTFYTHKNTKQLPFVLIKCLTVQRRQHSDKFWFIFFKQNSLTAFLLPRFWWIIKQDGYDGPASLTWLQLCSLKYYCKTKSSLSLYETKPPLGQCIFWPWGYDWKFSFD